jgi:hypothetical protein
MMTLENHKSDLFYDPFVDRVDEFDKKFGKNRRRSSDRSSGSKSGRDEARSPRSNEFDNSEDEVRIPNCFVIALAVDVIVAVFAVFLFLF